MKLSLIHIAPELPPEVGGVSDYTDILSRRLVEVSAGAIEPVLVHAGNHEVGTIDVDFPVINLSGQCSASALAAEISKHTRAAGSQAAVLLQYANYGYAENGIPWWLLRGLQTMREETKAPLLTMYHELYASGPPWAKQFWVSIAQAYVVRRLAHMSQGIVTNRPDSAEWLRETAERPVSFMPVFSNVGEPTDVAGSEDRGNYAVVFGGTGKEALYAHHGGHLERVLQSVEGVNRIVDLGPPSGQACRIRGIDIEERGIVAQEAVSRCLRGAALGFLCRNPAALTKSGVLAAYLSHGVPTVIAPRKQTAPNPALESGKHYVFLDGVLENAREWKRPDWLALGRRGKEWYTNNAHSHRVARTFDKLLHSAVPSRG